MEEAKKILADNPKDFTASYYIMLFTQPLYGQSQSPDILDDGEKAAKTILENIDTPPPNVAADQWAKLRPEVELMAHKNLGFIAMQRKNWDVAEAEFQKALMMDPNDATVDYQMGTVIASEKKLDKLPAAMFYFARAAHITWPGRVDSRRPEGRADLCPEAIQEFPRQRRRLQRSGGCGEGQSDSAGGLHHQECQ